MPEDWGVAPSSEPAVDRDELAARCDGSEIAIIGMSCRFPGAPDVDAFWSLLEGGHEAITEVPASRWDLDAWFDPEPGTVLDTTRGIEWARWFSGAGFNYVRMAVDEPAVARPDELALAWEGEDGEVRHFTRTQLRWAVDRAARAIAALGVGRGAVLRSGGAGPCLDVGGAHRDRALARHWNA